MATKVIIIFLNIYRMSINLKIKIKIQVNASVQPQMLNIN